MVKQRFCKAKTVEVRVLSPAPVTRKAFYDSPIYRSKQSTATARAWQNGLMRFQCKSIERKCARKGCSISFVSTPKNPKKYCSQSCAAIANNTHREVSKETREKIRASLRGRCHPKKQKAPLRYATCKNQSCNRIFPLRYWRPAKNPLKYCSRMCAIRDIGSRRTSPRAARARAGIRPDISPTLYFYSRWEANYARLLDYLDIYWVHQPRAFTLPSQKYTPDFYLPEIDTYIEIKNYLSAYSKKRDEEFRAAYPKVRLRMILGAEYHELERKYGHTIPHWEFRNSRS